MPPRGNLGGGLPPNNQGGPAGAGGGFPGAGGNAGGLDEAQMIGGGQASEPTGKQSKSQATEEVDDDPQVEKLRAAGRRSYSDRSIRS